MLSVEHTCRSCAEPAVPAVWAGGDGSCRVIASCAARELPFPPKGGGLPSPKIMAPPMIELSSAVIEPVIELGRWTLMDALLVDEDATSAAAELVFASCGKVRDSASATTSAVTALSEDAVAAGGSCWDDAALGETAAVERGVEPLSPLPRSCGERAPSRKEEGGCPPEGGPSPKLSSPPGGGGGAPASPPPSGGEDVAKPKIDPKTMAPPFNFADDRPRRSEDRRVC